MTLIAAKILFENTHKSWKIENEILGIVPGTIRVTPANI